jgi:hypothetical protein
MADVTASREDVDLERLRLETEKLRLEVEALRKRTPWSALSGQIVPVATILLGIASFWWGVRQYENEQEKNRSARQEQSLSEKAAAERAFMQPWLQSQRDAYAKALAAAANIANTSDPKKRSEAIEDFWRLYHGEMIPVETKTVSGAMVAFGQCLDRPDPCDRKTLNERTRALATAMAKSMAATASMTYSQFVDNRFEYTAGQ